MFYLVVRPYPEQRMSLGLSDFRNKLVSAGICSTQSVMRMFLSGDGASNEILMEKGKILYVILTTWMQLIHAWT